MPPTPHGINLAWTAVAGTDPAASYNIYRGTASGGPYAKLASSTSPSYSDASGAGGSTYFYVITAVDAKGNESGFSNQASATVPVDPNAPTGLTATAF